MRIALVSLSVRGALGQYTEALAQSLSRKTETHLFVPTHYEGDCGQAALHTFPTGNTRFRALLSLLNPFLARRVWGDICRIRPDVVHLLTGVREHLGVKPGGQGRVNFLIRLDGTVIMEPVPTVDELFGILNLSRLKSRDS